MALLRILNDLLAMIDGGNNALLILLDFIAAFDPTDHTLLLQRLYSEMCLHCSELVLFILARQVPTNYFWSFLVS